MSARSLAVTERAAAPSDVPAMLEIERASFGDPWSEATFRGLFANPSAIVRVAEHSAGVVGYAIAWVVLDEAELANIAVAPTHRRAGIGARLLDALLAVLDGVGVAATYLEVRESNAAAIALYASRGFAPSGRRRGYYAKPTEDAVLMRRHRPPAP